MKKLIPAVFLQKQLNGEKQQNGVAAAAKKPLVLDLFENEARKIVGGRAPAPIGGGLPAGGLRYSGDVTTYSGSEGWLDVAQADDSGL